MHAVTAQLFSKILWVSRIHNRRPSIEAMPTIIDLCFCHPNEERKLREFSHCFVFIQHIFSFVYHCCHWFFLSSIFPAKFMGGFERRLTRFINWTKESISSQAEGEETQKTQQSQTIERRKTLGEKLRRSASQRPFSALSPSTANYRWARKAIPNIRTRLTVTFGEIVEYFSVESGKVQRSIEPIRGTHLFTSGVV